MQGDNSEENDVVFGDGRIDQKSMSNFVAHYPDSTLKFLMRKNLNGRPLPVGYEEIYSQWENRGLSRGRLKKYLFKLMEWKNFPDIPVHDVVNKIREHQYFLEINIFQYFYNSIVQNNNDCGTERRLEVIPQIRKRFRRIPLSVVTRLD